MRKAAVSESRIDLPNIDTALFQQPDAQRLMAPERATHAPRFLLLYGSLRERSFSRLAAEEAEDAAKAAVKAAELEKAKAAADARVNELTAELARLRADRDALAAALKRRNDAAHVWCFLGDMGARMGMPNVA